GLEQSQRFRGLAPIAGALHPAVDPMLRQGRGKDTPMLVIHGVHDFIFPVAFTRQTCDLLKEIGYLLTYEELPEWDTPTLTLSTSDWCCRGLSPCRRRRPDQF